MSSASFLPTGLLLASLAAFFIAERIFGEGTASTVWLVLGVASMLGALALRGLRFSKAKEPSKGVEARLLGVYLLTAFSLVLYALSTDGGLELLGLEGSAAERVYGVLAALWPSVMLVALFALLAMEAAYRKMPIPAAVELRRVRSSAFGAVSLALAIVFLFSINYVASQDDETVDLTYMKASAPSEGTLQMAKALSDPIKIVLFFPAGNEVLGKIQPYFESVAGASKKLSLKVRDHALERKLAEKYRVQNNGFVVIVKGTGKSAQTEKIDLGTDMEVARSRLKTLDGRFQKSFAGLARIKRELHVTTGHDERSRAGVAGDGPGERIAQLETALERSNIKIEKLGSAQGLGKQVPENAPAVLVLGPRKPFTQDEALTLLHYVQRGGRLLLMVDPDVDHGLESLLRGLGLKLKPGVATSERHHLRRAYDSSDRSLIVSNRYTSHPTVTVATNNASQVGSVFIGAGGLEVEAPADGERKPQVVFPIRSHPQTWRDRNENYERDPDEKEEVLNLMAAVTVPNPGGEEGRAVVIADGSFVSDQVLRNPGNVLVFSDILNWMLGEEQIIGDAVSDEDIKIEHTRDEDKILFYLTSFGIPIPFLGAGVWIASRRRRRSRKETHAPGGGKSGASGGGTGTATTTGNAQSATDDQGEGS